MYPETIVYNSSQLTAIASLDNLPVSSIPPLYGVSPVFQCALSHALSKRQRANQMCLKGCYFDGSHTLR